MVTYIKNNNLSKEQTMNYLHSLTLKQPLDSRNIIINSKIIYTHNNFQTLQYKNNYYLYLLFPKYKILYKDSYKDYNFLYIYIVFLIIFLFAIVTYLWLINSLNLIHKAKQNIHSLTDKNFKENENDLLDDYDFNKYIKNIQLLIQSKQLFLRTIMHELNTPIAKGRIVSELIDDEKQRIRIGNIFDKLDFLINDFLKIEQMLSNKHNLITKKYFLHEIIEDSLQALMIKDIDKNVKILIDNNTYINADISLMSVVFKNFIDNAMKYSHDKKVTIKEYKNGVVFISKGDRLKKGLDEYFEPYHCDERLKKQGKGLGLYIAKSILDIHSFTLFYRYIKQYNIFYIDFKKDIFT